MSDVQTLLDIEAVKCLKGRYCLLSDAHAWDALRALFTENARFSTSSGEYVDARSFVEHLRAVLYDVSHVHVAEMPIIELTGENTARGLWCLSNRGALGHYEEEYLRVDGTWKIAAIKQRWIVPLTEEMRLQRKGAFSPVAEGWRVLAERWAEPANAAATAV